MPKKPNQPTPQERRRSRKAFRQAMTKELREHRSSFLDGYKRQLQQEQDAGKVDAAAPALLQDPCLLYTSRCV